MKIVDVKAYALREKVEHVYNWRRGLPGSGTESEYCWIRVLTDEGIEGVSLVHRGAIAVDLIARRIKAAVIGKDPLMKEELWKLLWELDRIEEFPNYMMGAIDMALWDITAKKANMPLYALLGGSTRKVRAYASTVTYDTLDQYLRIADTCLERGYKAIKLHAWGDAREDARLGRALRKHVGDDIALMYDGSAGFTLPDAVYLGKALEDAGFAWYEEPMMEFNISNYTRLCEQLTIPVLAAETSDGCHFTAAEFIHAKACDMIRTGTAYKGGITGGLRIAHLADAYQMKAQVHGYGLPNLHLACAIPNNDYFEVLVGDEPAHFYWDVDSDGFVHISDTPGIGDAPDWSEVEKKAFLQI